MTNIAKILDENSIPEPNTGCLLWTGPTNQWGHGLVSINGRTRSAHRLMWELFHGPIPGGLFVCHRCGVGQCINVDHLWLGTRSQMMLKGKSLADRIRDGSEYDPATGCLLWRGTIGKNGYGRIFVGNREYSVHRLAWELRNGKIPRFMFVCHKCDNPICINVDEHLFLGSAADNLHDCMKKGRQKTGGLKKDPGESHRNSKLTDKDVIEIRQKAAASTARGTRAKLAREYGITTANLSIIVLRKGWKHLP